MLSYVKYLLIALAFIAVSLMGVMSESEAGALGQCRVTCIKYNTSSLPTILYQGRYNSNTLGMCWSNQNYDIASYCSSYPAGSCWCQGHLHSYSEMASGS